MVLGQICPDELIVHMDAEYLNGDCGLHIWGDAVNPNPATVWAQPLLPTRSGEGGSVFRIRIFDENKQVHIIAHRGEERLGEWTLTPIQFNFQIWVYPGSERVYPKDRGAIVAA